MTILVSTEGTILMHASAIGKTREEIVQQSKSIATRIKETLGLTPGDINDYTSYIPVLNAPDKIKRWKEQGATIYYLSSRRTKDELGGISKVLQKYNFPDSQNLLFRQREEAYKDVAEKLVPDILVEDNCESIGGEREMTYTYLNPHAKSKVHPISIKEFGGIDHLPDDLEKLKAF